jgi:hypothetical protein
MFKQNYCYWCCPALQRTNTENSKQIFPEKELRGHSPNFHIHVSVSDLYIPRIGAGPHISCSRKGQIDRGNI